MDAYGIWKIKDKGKTDFVIYRKEDQSICLLPTQYLKHKKQSRRSPNTIRRIAGSLIYFMGYLKEQNLQFETPFQLEYSKQQALFQDFLDWVKAGKHSSARERYTPRNATCNAYLRDVLGFYQFLQLEYPKFGVLKVLSPKCITYTNAVGIQKSRTSLSFTGYLRAEDPKGSALEREGILTILRACTNCRDQVLLLLLSETGFRIGELLGIRYTEDIDYDKHAVKVEYREDNENDARAKNAAYRWAVISEETFEMLLFYLSKYRELLKDTKFLFVNLSGPNKGKALKVDAVYAFLRIVKEKTKTKGTPHMLRHYFAVERRKSGWDIPIISRALGHKSLETTIRYLDIGTDELAEASARFYERNASLYDTEQLL